MRKLLLCSLLVLPSFASALTIDDALDQNGVWQALDVADRTGDVLRAAELRLILGDFTGAEKNARAVLSKNSGDAAVRLLLARAERARQTDALSDALRAARDAKTPAVRGAAYLLASELQTELGDDSAAEKNAVKAATELPDDLDALAAVVRLKRSRPLEALAFAESAARVAAYAPLWQRPAAYRYSAQIWMELELAAKAAESLRRALAFNSEDLDALAYAVKIKAKLTPEALAGFRLKGAPVLPEAAEGPLSDADAKAALDKNPYDLEPLRRLATSALDAGRKDEASALTLRLMRAVWRAPVWHQAEAYRMTALLWLQLGQKDRAFQALAKALVLQQDSLETQRLGFGVPRGEEVSNNSVVLYIHCTAAEARLELGDRDGAVAMIDAALKLDPKHGWARRLKNSLKK